MTKRAKGKGLVTYTCECGKTFTRYDKCLIGKTNRYCTRECYLKYAKRRLWY